MNDRERQEYEASLARARDEEARRLRIADEVTRDRRKGLWIDAMWLRLGAQRVLVLRRAQVRALDAIDLAELRDVFGASPAMIDALVTLAADGRDDLDVRLDFEANTVATIET